MHSRLPASLFVGLGAKLLLLALVVGGGFLLTLAAQPPPANMLLAIREDYDRLFAPKGKLVQPAETMRVLRNLAERLQAQPELARHAVWAPRLKEIKTLMANNEIVSCKSEIGRKLSRSIDKYKYPRQEFPTIMAYLEHCRRKLFAKCNLHLDGRVAEALVHFADTGSSALIEYFREFLAKYAHELPQLTFTHDIPSQLLEFMNDSSWGEPLDSSMRREDFDDRFSRTLKSMCTDIKTESEFLAGFDILFTSPTECKEMEEELKELYRMRVVCGSIADYPTQMSDFLYKYLGSEAARQVKWRY